jgi:hypothetical protein
MYVNATPKSPSGHAKENLPPNSPPNAGFRAPLPEAHVTPNIHNSSQRLATPKKPVNVLLKSKSTPMRIAPIERKFLSATKPPQVGFASEQESRGRK